MEPISLEDLDEVDLLLTGLEISQGKGNLVLCIIASPAYREKVIEVIKARYPTRVLAVETGDKLISDLRNLKAAKKDIIVWVLPDSPSEDILEALNNFRELFYDAGVPSLVFMTPAGLNDVIWKAADFWRYRGGYHVFKGDEQGPSLQALDALSTPRDLRYKSEEELQRRKRINEYLLDKIKNKKEILKILLELGAVHILLGENDRAIEHCDKAIATARDIEDRRSEAEALINLGWAISGLGDFSKAIDYYDQALNIARKTGDRIREGYALDRLVAAHSAIGQRKEALEVALEAAQIRKTLTEEDPRAFRPDLATSLNNLGAMLSNLGRREEALAAATEASDIYRRLAKQNPQAFLPDLAMSFGAYGSVLFSLDRHAEALRAFAEGLQSLAPFCRKHPQAFTGLADALKQYYINACQKAGQEPDRDLLSQLE